MGELHKPVFHSLREFVEAEKVNPEEFDFKLQLDQELWVKHFEAVAGGDVYTRVRNRKAYERSAEEIRVCRIASKEPIERYWAYKKGCDRCTFDCDGTADNGQLELYINWLMREIYRTLWGWMDGYGGDGALEEKAVSRYGCCGPEYAGFALSLSMGPDTMNSMWMPLSNYLVLHYNDLFRWNRNKSTFLYRNKEDEGLTLPEMIQKYDLKLSDEVKKFAALTHAMGNMVLVPAGFNPYRGRTFKDYWDLSLEHLRKSNFLPEEAFVPYINIFFLWDYAEKDKTVRKLCEREEGGTFPGEKGCDLFFSNVNGCILNRGKFMHEMLRIALESPERYRQIIRKFSEEKAILSNERVSEISGIEYKRFDFCGILTG